MYGGSVQIGSGLGLLVTPVLLTLFGWRGSFLFWGLLGIASIITWLFVDDGQEIHKTSSINVGTGVRSPSVWTLELSHMGTFGLGNAIAAWIAVYLAYQAQRPRLEEPPRELAVTSLERDLDRLLKKTPTGELAVPAAPASDPDLSLPEVLVEQAGHLKVFVGRDEVLRRVAGWIDETAEGGYLLLLGPPGQGKSALMV